MYFKRLDCFILTIMSARNICIRAHIQSRHWQFLTLQKSFLSRTLLCDVTRNLGFGHVKNRILLGVHMSTLSDTTNMSKKQKVSKIFKFSDYDCVGFDLDNTLLRYKVTNMVKLEYEVLSRYLVNEKGYNSKYLFKPFEDDVDFVQKGLLIDFGNGNLLQTGLDGYVLNASHGTRFLNSEEIEKYYGPDRKWKVCQEFSRNIIAAWNGPLSKKVRTLLDYFDMPASLAFARIVDSLDDESGNKRDMYNVWPDVLAGLIDMFDRGHFLANKGGYFPAMKANPDQYINKCSKDVIDWLRKIKETKLVFLITGSNVDFASLTASCAMGDDWRSLFDVVVCYARKPSFFTANRPFLKIEGLAETDIHLEESDLKIGGIYSQGNWKDLLQLLKRATEQQHPKCLYVGDNLIQDIYTPAQFTVCDTVAIVEELSAEGMVGCGESHNDSEVLVSKGWGSYFYKKEAKEKGHSMWDAIIRKHSKICVPDLAVLASRPLDYEFDCFDIGEDGFKQVPLGYYPGYPTSLIISK